MLLEQIGGIVVHKFCRALGDVVRDVWDWAGSIQFDRDENNLKFYGSDISRADQEAVGFSSSILFGRRSVC